MCLLLNSNMVAPIEAEPFHQLRENFTPYSYDPYTPMYEPNRDGIYEVGNSIDIHNKVEELPQKLDSLLNIRYSPASSLYVCDICLSLTYLVSKYLAAY